MFDVFAKPKPCRVMMTLRDGNSIWHLSKIARDTGTTYVYVTKLVSKLEKAGLLMTEPKGKKKIVKLTEKGLVIANAIGELNSRSGS